MTSYHHHTPGIHLPTRGLLTALLLWLLPLSPATAGTPWLAPGDLAARHTLQTIADAGAITGPITTWPLSNPALHQDLTGEESLNLSADTSAMVAHSDRQLRRNMASGLSFRHAHATVTSAPLALRTFATSARTQDEGSFTVDWMHQRLAARVQLTRSAQTTYGHSARFDGSYVGLLVGDWMLSAGYVDRFWGPGWSTSLAWSTQARPMLSVAMERRQHTPWSFAPLSWLGPWNLITLVAQVTDDRSLLKTAIAGGRLTLRPHRGVTLGVNYLGQTCRTIGCHATGIDNPLSRPPTSSNNPTPTMSSPGGQLGVDARVTPLLNVPIAIYGQGVLSALGRRKPWNTYSWMGGVEAWGHTRRTTFRVYAEAIDGRPTPLDESIDTTLTNFSYEGQSQGLPHATRAKTLALGALWFLPDGHSLFARSRSMQWKTNAPTMQPYYGTSNGHHTLDLTYSYRWDRYTLSTSLGAVGTARLPDLKRRDIKGRGTLSLAVNH